MCVLCIVWIIIPPASGVIYGSRVEMKSPFVGYEWCGSLGEWVIREPRRLVIVTIR
jgi:hypothetical protein